MLRFAKKSVAWLICAAALAMVGCASPLNIARQSVSAAATIGRTAGDLVASVNADKQDQFLADLERTGDAAAAKAARDAWRPKRAIAVQALRVYNAAVVSAGVAVELAATKRDTATLGGIVSELFKLAAPLRDALKAFGVAIPGVN